VEAFNPDFVGLTGTPQQLQAVYDIFDVQHEIDNVVAERPRYLINHTATTFVLDPEGGVAPARNLWHAGRGHCRTT